MLCKLRFASPVALAASLGCWLSVMTAAPAAHAEPAAAPSNPFEVGIFGGLHFYNKDHGLGRVQGDATGTSPDHGGIFGLRLAYNLNRWIGIEAEGAISPTWTRNDSTRDVVVAYRGQVIGTFVHSGYIRPFALVGFGAMSAFPGTWDADDGQAYPRRRDTDASFHAGIGSKFPISDNLGLRLDGRVMVPPAAFSSSGLVGDETHYGGPDWEVLLSGYVGFGAEKPATPPPPAPAPIPVFEKDSDGDGILDKNDRCPDQAEDKDGFKDDDGCPDTDNDGDGVADQDDKCPNETEDKDGFKDDDGCPDADNDGDGIADQDDKCPNEVETVNGYQDGDGCPDEVPAAVKKFTGVIEGVKFKSNSAEISKGSFKTLDNTVQVLKDYPKIKLEIGGHTDNVGKPEHNKELSQKRADAVKKYLVDKGISADRLTAVGYGMEKPVTDNKTAADKAKNRRTEFVLLPSK